MSESCPCGSGLSYAACCEQIIGGAVLAQTPEQLMRSRYTAFCKKQRDYLIESHHPDARSANDAAELEASFQRIHWTGLQVLAASQSDEKSGVVEFRAHYLENGVAGELHERSRFVREAGRWFYLAGDIRASEAPAVKPGRNDPCWCGSGRKLKKCHG